MGTLVERLTMKKTLTSDGSVLHIGRVTTNQSVPQEYGRFGEGGSKLNTREIRNVAVSKSPLSL